MINLQKEKQANIKVAKNYDNYVRFILAILSFTVPQLYFWQICYL